MLCKYQAMLIYEHSVEPYLFYGYTNKSRIDLESKKSFYKNKSRIDLESKKSFI